VKSFEKRRDQKEVFRPFCVCSVAYLSHFIYIYVESGEKVSDFVNYCLKKRPKAGKLAIGLYRDRDFWICAPQSQMKKKFKGAPFCVLRN